MSKSSPELSASERKQWHEIYGHETISLPGGNFFRKGTGYLTSHIHPSLRRDSPGHWDGLLTDFSTFEKAWKPRTGPLELIYHLVKKNGRRPFSVLNMGGGIGDFTIDLARIPYTQVTHVDFSSTANAVAQRKINALNLSDKTSIVTADNKTFLQRTAQKNKVDFVFFYGSIGENLPQEQMIINTLSAGIEAIKNDGYLYLVMLVQPLITDPNDARATDILGEYPPRLTLVSDFLLQHPELYIVKEDIGERPDAHPLRHGGPPVEHTHVIQRILLTKNVAHDTPAFDFKNALNPEWPHICHELAN